MKVFKDNKDTGVRTTSRGGVNREFFYCWFCGEKHKEKEMRIKMTDEGLVAICGMCEITGKSAKTKGK